MATFHTDLSGRGPGLMLRDILKPTARAQAVARMIADIAPDIIVLQDVDYDAGLAGVGALADAVQGAGGPLYAHLFARRPNSGRMTDLDMDGDGLLRGPRDAQGYGRFAGAGGMAVMSVYPILADDFRDLSDLLWDDLPAAIAPDPPFPSAAAAAARRLSSVAHWVVPVAVEGRVLTLLSWSGTPPVFDGPEDLNGRRNHDETALWLRLLDGRLGDVPQPPFVVLGNANMDPEDGDGIPDAIRALLADPRLQDPEPRGDGAARAADAAHRGDPALDTAEFDGPGNLRVSYLLPSADIVVRDARVLWPSPGDAPDAFGPRSEWPRHRLVWADLTLR